MTHHEVDPLARSWSDVGAPAALVWMTNTPAVGTHNTKPNRMRIDTSGADRTDDSVTNEWYGLDRLGPVGAFYTWSDKRPKRSIKLKLSV